MALQKSDPDAVEEETKCWSLIVALVLMFIIMVFIILRWTGRLVLVWVSRVDSGDGEKVSENLAESSERENLATRRAQRERAS